MEVSGPEKLDLNKQSLTATHPVHVAQHTICCSLSATHPLYVAQRTRYSKDQ